MSIVVFHASNGMRFVDPVADFVLGFELLKQANRHICPWNRTVGHSLSQEGTPSDCRAHHVIAWTIITAAVLDFLILAAYINFMKAVMKVCAALEALPAICTDH